jgi:hypothetical protein
MQPCGGSALGDHTLHVHTQSVIVINILYTQSVIVINILYTHD